MYYYSKIFYEQSYLNCLVPSDIYSLCQPQNSLYFSILPSHYGAKILVTPLITVYHIQAEAREFRARAASAGQQMRAHVSKVMARGLRHLSGSAADEKKKKVKYYVSKYFFHSFS